jgi:TolA-binding protein
MRSTILAFLLILVCCASSAAVFAQGASPANPKAAQAAQDALTTELADQGVSIEPDKRLIVLMAALEAAGFDPTPGKEPSVFRKRLHEDQQNLNPDLRRKLKEFFDRGNKMRNRVTPAEQAAPYISMVYSLSPAPELADPPRIDDLPGELLDVLDFAPLLREFYRRSNIEERMPDYIRAYQGAGEEMRASAVLMTRELLTYLHTKAQVAYVENVQTSTKIKGKGTIQKVEAKEHIRRFFISPDLMAVPGTVNFRNIGDDYYVIVPPGTNLVVSEARRAYLQFIFDPLVIKNAKELTPQRDAIRKLIDDRDKKGGTVSPDIFLSVTRSLVAAADARQEEFELVNVATYRARQRIAAAKDDAAKKQIAKELSDLKAAAADETIARLSEAYEKGAVLSFYFSEQLKGIEESGFDVSGALTDMIYSLDAAKEADRLTQNAEARKRAIAAREDRKRKQQEEIQTANTGPVRNKVLDVKLKEATDLISLKSYDRAEEKLSAMQQDYPGDATILYYRGLAASLSATEAIDDQVRDERLGRAAAHYRSAILAAQSSDSDKALLSQAHYRLGRILEFNDQTAAAKAEYDAVVRLGPIDGGALREAQAAMQKLQKP